MSFQQVLLTTLEPIAWDELHTHHGTAEQLPDWILQLASSDEGWRLEGLQALWAACGADTEVTPCVVPFLIRLLQEDEIEGKAELLHLLASFVPLDHPNPSAFSQIAAIIFDVCCPFLEDQDSEAREGAFTLVTRFPTFFTRLAPSLRDCANGELEITALERMLESYARLINHLGDTDSTLRYREGRWLVKFTGTPYPALIRFHAALIIARWIGTETPKAVSDVLIDAALRPAAYAKYRSELLHGPIVEQACEALSRLTPEQAIMTFTRMLTAVRDPEDAHLIAIRLFDLAFGGAPRRRYTALPPDYPAERPDNTRVKFRAWRTTPEQLARKRARGRLYLRAEPLDPATLDDLQRAALNAALNAKLLWMLHSNLLETIGLPAFRAEAEAILRPIVEPGQSLQPRLLNL